MSALRKLISGGWPPPTGHLCYRKHQMEYCLWSWPTVLLHSLRQGWYSGLLSSLIHYGSGYAYLHGDPGDSRSGLLSADRVLVSCLCASNMEKRQRGSDDCSLLLPASKPAPV